MPKPLPAVFDPEAYLASLTMHGIKLGLENIRALLHAAGDPHRAYPTIHVAGTNGKGSVCALLSAMLRCAGYRVGTYTSPHLIDVRERFLVDGNPCAQAELESHLHFYREATQAWPHPPTFFEMTTAVAFRHFAQASVDVGVIEVGMGGRLDSTNVVEPVATAITTIDFDHMAYLGDTLAAIAGEKAGIIKNSVPVVLGKVGNEASSVIEARAAECYAPVQRLGTDVAYRAEGPVWAQRLSVQLPGYEIIDAPLRLSGRHQAENAAIAIALATRAAPHFPRLDADAIRAGLAAVSWPCRLERVLDQPPVIVDVAHNPAGAAHVASAIPEAVVVFAASSDKDYAGMLRALAPSAVRFVLTEYDGKRCAPAATVAESVVGKPYDVVPDMDAAIRIAIEAASTAKLPVVITGSVYAAGEARRRLVDGFGASPAAF